MSMDPTVTAPDNLVKANLLLEKAICNCKVQYIQKSLTDQVVRRDVLQLQYSRLQVEKARLKLTAACHKFIFCIKTSCFITPLLKMDLK